MSINLVQDFSVTIDSFVLLDKYLQLAVETILWPHEEIAVKEVIRQVPGYNLYLPEGLDNEQEYFPVLLVGGGHKHEHNTYFNGYEPSATFTGSDAVESALKHIIELCSISYLDWEKEFLEKMGDGYNSAFNRMGGDINVGYELKKCSSFPAQLAISPKHIYYGK